jgi:hypothetical protein
MNTSFPPSSGTYSREVINSALSTEIVELGRISKSKVYPLQKDFRPQEEDSIARIKDQFNSHFDLKEGTGLWKEDTTSIKLREQTREPNDNTILVVPTSLTDEEEKSSLSHHTPPLGQQSGWDASLVEKTKKEIAAYFKKGEMPPDTKKISSVDVTSLEKKVDNILGSSIRPIKRSK